VILFMPFVIHFIPFVIFIKCPYDPKLPFQLSTAIFRPFVPFVVPFVPLVPFVQFVQFSTAGIFPTRNLLNWAAQNNFGRLDTVSVAIDKYTNCIGQLGICKLVPTATTLKDWV
jgi:hypothetical protein